MLDFYTDFLLTSFGGACATKHFCLSDGTISHDRVIRFPKRRGATPYIAKKNRQTKAQGHHHQKRALPHVAPCLSSQSTAVQVRAVPCLSTVEIKLFDLPAILLYS